MKTPALASVLLAASFVLTLRNSSQKEQLEDVDYEVYSQVLQTHFASDRYLVIGDHTLMEFPPVMMASTGFGGSPQMKKLRADLSNETAHNYDQKNKASIALENRFSVKIPVVLLSASERDNIFSVEGDGASKRAGADGFNELNRLYPGAVAFMHVSRIGFDAKKTQALVYVGFVCGGLCGQGQFFLLVKEGSIWRIRHAATSWVS